MTGSSLQLAPVKRKKSYATETVRLFFGGCTKQLLWQESRMFWVTWQNAWEHIPSCCVAQFFLHANLLSCRCLAFVVSTT